MNVKKKYFRALAGLGAGAVLLSAAVFANYDSANGYTNCKTALKGLLDCDNMSIDHTTEVSLDGERAMAFYGSLKVHGGGNPSFRAEQTCEYGDASLMTIEQKQDGKMIYTDINEDGKKHSYYYQTDTETKSVVAQMNESGNNLGNKVVSFAETIGDALIGDLKNNFVLTSEEDGQSTYSISLTREQMPSYVNSGISVLASLVTSNTDTAAIDEDELLPPEKAALSMFGSSEPYVRDAQLTMTVDDELHPTSVICTINFVGYDRDGGEHTLSLSTDLELYDFGSTEIEPISEEELLAMDKSKYYID
ncbi:MAG: hypothetical protein Q4E94_05295 [Clostridia bacterium]|nr:hypothetical protein [Clostridia bacterium]